MTDRTGSTTRTTNIGFRYTKITTSQALQLPAIDLTKCARRRSWWYRSSVAVGGAREVDGTRATGMREVQFAVKSSTRSPRQSAEKKPAHETSHLGILCSDTVAINHEALPRIPRPGCNRSLVRSAGICLECPWGWNRRRRFSAPPLHQRRLQWTDESAIVPLQLVLLVRMCCRSLGVLHSGSGR